MPDECPLRVAASVQAEVVASMHLLNSKCGINAPVEFEGD